MWKMWRFWLYKFIVINFLSGEKLIDKINKVNNVNGGRCYILKFLEVRVYLE